MFKEMFTEANVEKRTQKLMDKYTVGDTVYDAMGGGSDLPMEVISIDVVKSTRKNKDTLHLVAKRKRDGDIFHYYENGLKPLKPENGLIGSFSNLKKV